MKQQDSIYMSGICNKIPSVNAKIHSI